MAWGHAPDPADIEGPLQILPVAKCVSALTLDTCELIMGQS